MQKEKSASTKELEQVNEGGDTDNSQALGMFFFCLKRITENVSYMQILKILKSYRKRVFFRLKFETL